MRSAALTEELERIVKAFPDIELEVEYGVVPKKSLFGLFD
jgi:hypothetical protein